MARSTTKQRFSEGDRPSADVSEQVRMRSAAGAAELVVLHAHSLSAAEEAIRMVRGNGTVVLNFATMSPSLSQRLLDVVRGGLCAIDGVVEPIGADVLLLSPAWRRLKRPTTHS